MTHFKGIYENSNFTINYSKVPFTGNIENFGKLNYLPFKADPMRRCIF